MATKKKTPRKQRLGNRIYTHHGSGVGPFLTTSRKIPTKKKPAAKLIPDTIGVSDRSTGRFYPNARVLGVVAHPPGSHGGPIRSDVTAVEIVTSHGTRWYGFKRAWITSSLKMAVELLPGQERDEVVARWKSLKLVGQRKKTSRKRTR